MHTYSLEQVGDDCSSCPEDYFGALCDTYCEDATTASENHEFCAQNEKLCIKNEEFCIKNEGLCIKNEGLCIKNEEFCEFCSATAEVHAIMRDSASVTVSAHFT